MKTTDTHPAQTEQLLHEADFADMHIRVGDHIFVQPVAVLDADHLMVAFIGAHQDRSFITTLPEVQNKGMWVKPGSSFHFRIVHGMYAYAFTSSLLCHHAQPYPHAHFAIPAAVKYRQVRQAIRLDTRLPVELRRANGTQTLAIMLDISQFGAKLELSGFLDEVGAEIEVSIPIVLPDRASNIRAAASIRNVSDTDRSMASGRFHYGIAFKDLGSEDVSLLEHFIEHLLVEKLA